MAIETAVRIDIEVLNDGTVRKAADLYDDLGDAVSKTQLKAEELAKQFGINDARTQQAIKVAGKYKAEMEQLDFAIEGAKGGSQQLLKGTQAIVGGFEAAIGAAALFGGESEELEAALLKVQGAMALSQGLADFQEFSPALKNLGKTITGPLTSAFKNFGNTMKTTLAASGIGLLVLAVGTLVAYWDDIKAAVSGVSEEQKKLLKDQEASVAASKQQLDNISAQENILKQQGYTEQEILNMKIAATKNTITELEAQIKQQKIVRDQQIETAKRNKEILSGILKFVEAPLYILLKGIDVALNAFGKESDLANQFADFGASLLFDPEEVEKEADATIEAQEKELMTLKNNLAGYEMNITKIHREENKKRGEIENKYYNDRLERIKKQNEDELSEYEKLNELLLSIEVEKLNARGQNFDAEVLQLEDKYKKELELAKGNAQKIFFIEQRRLIELEQLRKKYDNETDKNIQSVFEKRKAQNDAREAVELRRQEIFQQKLADSYKAINNLTSAAQQFVTNSSAKLDEDFQNRIDRLKDLGYTEEQIANMRDKELKKIDERAKKAFELEKKLRYTQTLLSTIEGVQNAFTTANKSPLTAVFPAYPYVQAGAAAAFGIAQLQQISQTKYQSKMLPTTSSGKGGDISGVPQMSAPRLGGVLNPDNEITQQRKVYVVESDITSTQAKVSNTQKVSLVE